MKPTNISKSTKKAPQTTMKPPKLQLEKRQAQYSDKKCRFLEPT